MKWLKVYNREDRKWLGDIVVTPMRFALKPSGISDADISGMIELIIAETQRKQPQRFSAVEKDEMVVEIFRNEVLETNKENLTGLHRALDLQLPALRFVEVDDDIEPASLREENIQETKKADFLSGDEKNRVVDYISKADPNEQVLIKNDLVVLKRLSGIF